MDNFQSARMAMIDSQLRASGVTDGALLRAISRTPREKFVADNRASVAYVDDLQPLGRAGRFLLSPSHFGRMAQLAAITPSDKVLDYGAASGYSTAVLAQLGREVIGVEHDSDLALTANGNLLDLDIRNARVVDGSVDALEGHRFDAILVEGAIEDEPTDLIAVLAEGGRLVAPLLRRGIAVIHVFTRSPGGVMFTSEFDATMPRLGGRPIRDEFVF